MNKLILAILLSLSMTAHAQVSGPGNTFGGGGGSVYRFLTSSGDFPRFGECVNWSGGKALSCSAEGSGLVMSSPSSVVAVRFASSAAITASGCKVTGLVSNASGETVVGSFLISNGLVGTSSSGISYSLGVGDVFKVMVGEGFGDANCGNLSGTLEVGFS